MLLLYRMSSEIHVPTILTKESDPASHSDDIGHPKCKQEPLNDFNKRISGYPKCKEESNNKKRAFNSLLYNEI